MALNDVLWSLTIIKEDVINVHSYRLHTESLFNDLPLFTAQQAYSTEFMSAIDAQKKGLNC